MEGCLQSVLDEMGAEAGCTAVSHEDEFVVARPEAIYLYTPDGRGPCFVFDGSVPFHPPSPRAVLLLVLTYQIKPKMITFAELYCTSSSRPICILMTAV